MCNLFDQLRMEKPVFTVTEVLVDKIWYTIKALLMTYRAEPQDNKIVKNREVEYIRLQDWPCIQEFSLVKKSSWFERCILHCIYHKAEIKD